MISANVKHQYRDNPVVVLEIDWEGAEYLAYVLQGEYLLSNDGAAKDISEALSEQVEYLKMLKANLDEFYD